MTATAVKPVTEMTPVEIDTELARISGEEAKYQGWLVSARHYLSTIKVNNDRVLDATRTIDRFVAKLKELRAEARPFEEEYRNRGGWNRYFLVANVNGHVHRGMNCSTCYYDTQYNWLIDLADCDEAAMVAEWGEKACTICFPDAPTFKGFGDGTSAYARRTYAEQLEVDREKAQKAAEKAEKAITAPNGTPLRVGYDTLRTKVAASRALSGAIKSYGWYGPTHPNDFAGQITKLIEALEAAGVDTAPIITRALKASAKEGAQYAWPRNA